MPATLAYITHTCDPSVTCAICLEPVDENAVKTSCHAFLLCADCLGHWLTSLLLANKQTKCVCRSTINCDNMKPLVFERKENKWYWMDFEYEDTEGEEYEDGFEEDEMSLDGDTEDDDVIEDDEISVST